MRSTPHSTIFLRTVHNHLRSVARHPSLKKHRNLVEDALLRRLRQLCPESVRITIVADRGFGDQKLYAFLRELNMDYIIRFRSNIRVTDNSGLGQPAQAFVPKNHRAKRLLGARVTADEYPVGAVVLIHDRGMQQSWCLATSRTDLSARQIIGLYAKRFSCEETFRDPKNARLGLGMSVTHIQDTLRKDRLLMICALAMALLTLLGAAGESLGEDRMLKVNTVKTRTHSLFRQGLFYYQAMDTWPLERSARLLARFSFLLSEHAWCRKAFGLV